MGNPRDLGDAAGTNPGWEVRAGLLPRREVRRSSRPPGGLRRALWAGGKAREGTREARRLPCRCRHSWCARFRRDSLQPEGLVMAVIEIDFPSEAAAQQFLKGNLGADSPRGPRPAPRSPTGVREMTSRSRLGVDALPRRHRAPQSGRLPPRRCGVGARVARCTAGGQGPSQRALACRVNAGFRPMARPRRRGTTLAG